MCNGPGGAGRSDVENKGDESQAKEKVLSSMPSGSMGDVSRWNVV